MSSLVFTWIQAQLLESVICHHVRVNRESVRTGNECCVGSFLTHHPSSSFQWAVIMTLLRLKCWGLCGLHGGEWWWWMMVVNDVTKVHDKRVHWNPRGLGALLAQYSIIPHTEMIQWYNVRLSDKTCKQPLALLLLSSFEESYSQPWTFFRYSISMPI